jgi:predicted nucleotidyltransferase
VTSATGSSQPADRWDPLAAYDVLLQRAGADRSVVGVVVFGSRAVGADLTPGSDVDCFVIVDGTPEEAERWRTHGSEVEAWPMTLDTFRTHALHGDDGAWNRPTFIRARVDLDKLNGEIGAIVERKRRLSDDEAKAVVADSLDDAINMLYRALKSAEAGRREAARLDAAQAIGPLLTAAFALESRVRPWNRWLERELAIDPLATPAFADLVARAASLAADPTPQTIHAAFRMLDEGARDAGYGASVDDWHPYVTWLRGEGPYRSPRT